MFIALTILSILLALLAVNSAAGKIRKNEQVLATIVDTVGLPERFLPVLAVLEIAGAVGVVLGLWIAPIGIAAAAGLVLYFLGAAISHLRVNDLKGSTMPLVPLALSVVVLTLRLLTF